MKRFNLILTDEEYEGLKKASKAHNTSMSALLRIYLRIGLNGEKPGTSLIIRKHQRDLHVYIV